MALKDLLLEPTEKFNLYIRQSDHYLNDPKHMLNEWINDLCRGYDRDKSISNLIIFFSQTGHRFSNKKIGEIVDFHHSITIQQLRLINPNLDVNKEFADHRTQEISDYIERKTTWAFGRRTNQPSFPFRTKM